MIYALTQDQSSKKRWEAGNGKMNIFSVDGFYLTLNPNFQSEYLVDSFNPKILVYSTLDEALIFISKETK